ncbi:hypothetical protein A7J05_33590 [Streptomyces alfalfae]|uniref:Uncharacterized protein n=1 Tax=Streptomyces alfalfae TaxID=1642299 RepID=A0ABM6H1A6_9ACTN|nr:hypothetical protein A7J05_33590 [Streptomyces alfalfae]
MRSRGISASGKPQLLALVRVERAGQRQGEQGGGTGPAGAERQVGGDAEALALEGEAGVVGPP